MDPLVNKDVTAHTAADVVDLVRKEIPYLRWVKYGPKDGEMLEVPPETPAFEVIATLGGNSIDLDARSPEGGLKSTCGHGPAVVRVALLGGSWNLYVPDHLSRKDLETSVAAEHIQPLRDATARARDLLSELDCVKDYLA